MNWVKIAVLALIVSLGGTIRAADYGVGTVINGYVLGSDGHWYLGNQAYRRAAYKQKVLLNHCQYYWKTQYRFEPIINNVRQKQASYKDWRERLLDIAATRDKYAQAARNSVIEHNEFLEAVKALNLEGHPGLHQNIRYPQGYQQGYQQPYSNHGEASNNYGQQYVPNAQQGNTVYGYSYSSLASLYNQNDLSTLYQQIGRNAKAAAELTSHAHQSTVQLAEIEGTNKARIAMILAKAELLKAAAEPEAHFKAKLQVYGTAPLRGIQSGGLPLSSQTPQQVAGSLRELLATKCYSCHSGGRIEGTSQVFPQGADLTQYATFAPEQKHAVLQATLNGSMPKEGEPLTVEEMGLFYADWLNCVTEVLGLENMRQGLQIQGSRLPRTGDDRQGLPPRPEDNLPVDPPPVPDFDNQ